MYNNTPVVSKVQRMNYSVNVWYQFVLVSRWNKVDVYFVNEIDYNNQKMTPEMKKKFIENNEPIMSFFHDAIKGGNIGF